MKKIVLTLLVATFVPTITATVFEVSDYPEALEIAKKSPYAVIYQIKDDNSGVVQKNPPNGQ